MFTLLTKGASAERVARGAKTGAMNLRAVALCAWVASLAHLLILFNRFDAVSPGAADATHNAGIALKSPVATSAAAPGDTTSKRLKRMRRCASDATHAQSATARRFIAPVVAFRATRSAEAPPTGTNNNSYVLQT